MGSFSQISSFAQGILEVTAMFAGIVTAWFALGAVNWEVFVKSRESAQTRLLRLLLAILIGAGLANFVVQYVLAVTLMRA